MGINAAYQNIIRNIYIYIYYMALMRYRTLLVKNNQALNLQLVNVKVWKAILDL